MQQVLRVRTIEERVEVALALQIDGDEGFERRPGPVDDEVSLADLAGAPDDQGLAARAVAPLVQVVFSESPHTRRSYYIGDSDK